MSERNCYLMRTPSKYIEESLIVYGWEKINFSEFNNATEVLDAIKQEYSSYGRKGNQIKRFFNLKENDIVIVPMKRAIAIGIVKGEKTYLKGHKHECNRVAVNFKCPDGKIRKISTRTNILTNSLLGRLRVRQTNVSLNSFSKEIEEKLLEIACLEKNQLSDLLETNLSHTEDLFKDKLLNNIKTGKNIRLKGGGDGFESLILELLKIEDFSAKIQSKKSNKGLGDIDIIASRDEFFGGVTELVIQAKHHKGTSSIKSLNQVITAIKNNEVTTNAIPMVISTGSFNEETKEEAEKNNIILMDGKVFIDWLYRNIFKLPVETQLKLGVSQVPTLLTTLE